MDDISQIVVKKVYPFEVLEQRLLRVTVEHNDHLVYQNATIKLKEYCPEKLNLTTNYLLREKLLFQQALREHLTRNYGIDPFNLEGIVILDTPDGEIPLAPPIVEHMHIPFVSPQQVGRGCTRLSLDVLLDGAHRCYLARHSGESIRCIQISEVDELYQVPIIPNGWNEVMLVDQLPDWQFKKRYVGDSLVMYRDFSSLGSGGYRV